MEPLFPIVVGLIVAVRSALFTLSHVDILDPGPHFTWIGG
jgi:hypothetical protein